MSRVPKVTSPTVEIRQVETVALQRLVDDEREYPKKVVVVEVDSGAIEKFS